MMFESLTGEVKKGIGFLVRGEAFEPEWLLPS